MPDWFSVASVVAFALGLIAGHWLPRLAYRGRRWLRDYRLRAAKRRIRRTTERLNRKRQESDSIVPIHRRPGA